MNIQALGGLSHRTALQIVEVFVFVAKRFVFVRVLEHLAFPQHFQEIKDVNQLDVSCFPGNRV